MQVVGVWRNCEKLKSVFCKSTDSPLCIGSIKQQEERRFQVRPLNSSCTAWKHVTLTYIPVPARCETKSGGAEIKEGETGVRPSPPSSAVFSNWGCQDQTGHYMVLNKSRRWRQQGEGKGWDMMSIEEPQPKTHYLGRKGVRLYRAQLGVKGVGEDVTDLSVNVAKRGQWWDTREICNWDNNGTCERRGLCIGVRGSGSCTN